MLQAHNWSDGDEDTCIEMESQSAAAFLLSPAFEKFAWRSHISYLLFKPDAASTSRFVSCLSNFLASWYWAATLGHQ